MKTTSELSGKWWYRLIKVVYLFSLLVFIVGIPIGISVGYNPEYDNQKSYIKCANGKEFRLAENGITLYTDYLWTSDESKAKGLCFDGTIGTVENSYGQKQLKITSQTEDSGKYELVSFYTDRDWFATIGYSLLGILGTLFFFEIIRRVFYYVILGSIRPKKHNREQ